MSPGNLLTIVLLITAGAAVGEFLLRKMYRKRLQRLADKWGMNYSPVDQFRLTPRHAEFPGCRGGQHLRGGSDLRERFDRYRYVFTAEYTAGVVSGKHRVVRAGTFSESRDRTGPRWPNR